MTRRIKDTQMKSRNLVFLGACFLLSASPALAFSTVWGGQFIESNVSQPRSVPVAFTAGAHSTGAEEEPAPALVFNSYPSNDLLDEIQKRLGVHDGQMDFYTVRFERTGASTFAVGANRDGLMLKAAW